MAKRGPVTDAEATAILGEKCPDCGWRGDTHRPPITIIPTPACPHWPDTSGPEPGP